MSASTTLVPRLRNRIHWRAHWKPLARVLLSIAVLWLIAAQVNISEVRQAFVRLRPGYLVPVVLVLSPLSVLLRALRWRCLLPGGDRVPLLSYVRAYVIGMLANSLLLGKFGDLVKARLICGSQVDYARSLAVVVVDRLLEGLALLVVFTAVLFTSDLPGWTYRLAWLAGITSLAGLVGLRSLFEHRDTLLGATRRAVGRLPASLGSWLLTTVQRLLVGCGALANNRRVVLTMLYGLSVWGVEIAAVTAFLAAFSIPTPWFVSATVLLVVLNFGMLVPISPGSIGVYQLLCVFALSVWGVDRELAFAFGIVMQTVLFLPLYLVGLVWMLMSTQKKYKESSPPALAQ